MTFSLSYRRVKAHSRGLRNSHESQCGPRFEFLVDGRAQFLSTEQRFLSEGTLTYFGNATIAPNVNAVYEFRVGATDCDHSKLLVWGEHRLVLSEPKDRIQVDLETLENKKFAGVDFK
jgi:hypothetical protein